MLDTVRIVAQGLATADPVTALAFRILTVVVLGSAAAVALTCAGLVLAHCCREGSEGGVRTVLILAGLLLGVGGVLAAPTQGATATPTQGAESQDSIPQVEPRFQRLFGSDSMTIRVELRQGRSGLGISTSPDGRWLLFSAEEEGHSSLRISPVAGGEPIRLASGHYGQWAPSGDAVLFLSASGGNLLESHVMRLPIAPGSGEPLGPPRQVTLDAVWGFAVSPDGQKVAYTTGSMGWSVSLRVLPATGGTSRTVVDLPGAVLGVRWDAEGRFLYYLYWADIQAPGPAVMRIPAEGGEPQRVSVWDDWIRLSPRARYVYRYLYAGDGDEAPYEITTVEGRPLAHFTLPRSFDVAGFVDEGKGLIVVRNDDVNPLRIVPVAGGAIRYLNEAWGYDVPLAWTGDASEVFFQTELNGRRVFMLAPVDGSPMRQVPVPVNVGTHWPVLSADGRLVLYEQRDSARGRSLHYFLYNIEEDATLEVELPPEPLGGGPIFSLTDEQAAGIPGVQDAVFGYGVNRNGHQEVYLVDRTGRATLAWSFQAYDPEREGAEFPLIAVHGRRLVFTENDGEEGTLYMVRAGEEEARPLLRLPGRLSSKGSGGPTWSPDGRVLALSYAGPDTGSRDALLLRVTEAGDLDGEPRTLPMDGGPDSWIGLQWMPDGEHFLVVGEKNDDTTSRVWLISLDLGTPPVDVTADLDANVWYYYLSPDGRYIAIESEIPRGGSIWRVDLGGALTGPGR